MLAILTDSLEYITAMERNGRRIIRSDGNVLRANFTPEDLGKSEGLSAASICQNIQVAQMMCDPWGTNRPDISRHIRRIKAQVIATAETIGEAPLLKVTTPLGIQSFVTRDHLVIASQPEVWLVTEPVEMKYDSAVFYNRHTQEYLEIKSCFFAIEPYDRRDESVNIDVSE